MTKPSLTEFLLARIAEDEEVARQPDLMWPSSWTAKFRDYEALRETKPRDYAVGRYCTQFDPARVLAECEAKRRIVEELTEDCAWDGTLGAQSILQLLAAPYADHPDFDQDWRT
jgi:hypothetical protein